MELSTLCLTVVRVGEVDYLYGGGLPLRLNFYLQYTPSAVGRDSVVVGTHPGNCP